MKRLGGYLCIGILAVIFFGAVYSSPVAYAQTQGSSISEYQTKGKSLFDNQLRVLNERKSNPNSTSTVATSIATLDALIAAVSAGSSVFISNLNTGTEAPSLRYERALNLASNTISERQRNDSQNLRTPYATEVIRAFTRQLGDEAAAERKLAALQDGGYTQAEAQTLGQDLSNARNEAVNTVAAGNKEPVGKCSLFAPSNISACIDEGFAWLIKNTFLQIAGFLAWLSANMLNLAIQFSILDFAKWSPTSLYPIWVIIRQIVSLVVVFAGLYLGFMYIIGREDTFGKYIGWLAVFALFVNFSYPVTRALVDVSNIVSLNVYSSAVGGEALSGTGGNTAGALIVSKLGLTDLFVSATTVTTESGFNVKTGSGFVGQINTTPGALAAVAFALYAAFVLFMATGILVMRAAVFSFLIVASPLLLVDAVVPKLGDVAVKMRKMFFEQLIVAPVFMLMLALTLKFMDVFQTTGPLAAGGDSVKVFFNLLMMTIMLHIMLKVTKAAAGTAGEMATNVIGKVGGFGLGVATGGAGLLARGSVGIAAARMRDSGWMDKMQGSRTGRGLYGLSNSLAQSTFDARNIGMVNRGMASAGMGMGKGTTQTYDKDFEARDLAMKKKYGSIKDGSAREGYIAQKTSGVGANWLQTKGIQTDAQKTAESIKKDEDKLVKSYARKKDGEKEEYLESLPTNVQQRINPEMQATKAEIIADEQRTNPTQEAKMMSAAEIAEMQKNFKAAANQPNYQSPAGNVDVTKESFAERRKMKQAEAQRNIDSGNKNNEGGTEAPVTPAPKPSSPSPAAASAIAA